MNKSEIAKLIREQDELHEWDTSPAMYEKYADAILAAGYIKGHPLEVAFHEYSDESLELANSFAAEVTEGWFDEDPRVHENARRHHDRLANAVNAFRREYGSPTALTDVKRAMKAALGAAGRNGAGE